MSDELQMLDYDSEWVTQFGSPEQKARMAKDLEACEQEAARTVVNPSGEIPQVDPVKELLSSEDYEEFIVPHLTGVDGLPSIDGQWDGGDSYELEPLKSLEQRERDEANASVDAFMDQLYVDQSEGEPVDDLTNDLHEAGFIDDGPDYELEPPDWEGMGGELQAELDPNPEVYEPAPKEGSGAFSMGGKDYETTPQGWKVVNPDGSRGDPVVPEGGLRGTPAKRNGLPSWMFPKKPGFVTGRGPGLAQR